MFTFYFSLENCYSLLENTGTIPSVLNHEMESLSHSRTITLLPILGSPYHHLVSQIVVLIVSPLLSLSNFMNSSCLNEACKKAKKAMTPSGEVGIGRDAWRRAQQDGYDLDLDCERGTWGRRLPVWRGPGGGTRHLGSLRMMEIEGTPGGGNLGHSHGNSTGQEPCRNS